LATKDALKSPVRENRTPGSVGGRQLLEEEADLSTRQSPHIDQKGSVSGQNEEKSKRRFGLLAILTTKGCARSCAVRMPLLRGPWVK
ncbi:MAG: hypothetical protein QM270_05270, partial [Bacillota bacterium]|nr:hypothetical protein [Bacillota bacterium]